MRVLRTIIIIIALGVIGAGASSAPLAPAPVAAPAPAPVAAPAPAPAAPASLAMRPAPAAHGGFVSDMDCSACHTTGGWQLAQTAGASGFDHGRTGFPLRGAHTQTPCTGCHTGQAKPSTSCEGCHRDPHQGQNDGSCAECHTATAWSDTQILERHRRTRMPLTGRHAVIDCTACHRRSGAQFLRAVPADCYACHRAEYHASKLHPVHDGSAGSAPFSRNCGQCHRTSGWEPAFGVSGMLERTVARIDHDAVFMLTSGSHRAAACESCHPDARRSQLVRCDGCHQDTALRAQHRTPVSRSAAACLGCHPRGAIR